MFITHDIIYFVNNESVIFWGISAMSILKVKTTMKYIYFI